MSYDRYKKFLSNGTIRHVPFIPIPKRASDKYVNYDKRKHRLDVLSYQYYDDPNYGWLILQANPSVGSLEFNIPQGTRLRIPYPLESVLITYANGVDEYYRIN